MLSIILYLALANANVIGIDFGSENIKVSLIKPGKKLVIVENADGDRMTVNGFAMKEKEFLFGLKARNALSKFPDSSVRDVKQVMGKGFDDLFVRKVLNQSFSTLEIVQSFNGGVGYKILNRTFTIEEISGLILENIGKFTNTYAGTSIKDCVITIPSNYNRLQKQSLLSSLTLSNLNLLSFIQENSASALYYSIDQINDDTDHLMLLYNIGSQYTQVSLFTLWGYKENNKNLNFIEALGHESSEAFGGNIIDYELSQLLIKEFWNVHQIDLNHHPKALAKVLREVNLAKKTLSANKKTEVFIENLVNELGFKFEISRDAVDSIVEKYRSEILMPAEKLLAQLGFDCWLLDEIELVGGVSKIPKVQEVIEKRFLKKVAFRVHPSESMAHGAALLAAKESATVSSTSFSLVDVFSCFISVQNSFEDITVFPKYSKFNSKKTMQILVPESKTITLSETCTSTIIYYKYTFTESGLISLTFSLDSKGFAFINSASLEGTPLKFSATEISVPRKFTDSEIEEILKSSTNSKQSENENEYLSRAKNDVETMLYFFKDKMQEESFTTVLSEEESEKVLGFIQELESWMESEEFESVTETDIRQKVAKFREPLIVMMEKENDYKMREKMINDGQVYLNKINQFMRMVNETATWIPRDEIEEGWHVLRETEKWFNDKLEEQKSLKNWEKPAISSKEWDNKFLFLRSQLDKFANYKPPASEPKDSDN